MASATAAPAPRAPLSALGANKAFNDKVYSRYSIDIRCFVKTRLPGKADGGPLVQPSRCERHVASNLMDVYFKNNNVS